jgi:hypothetical protein
MLGFGIDIHTRRPTRIQGIPLISEAGLEPNVMFQRASTAYAYASDGTLNSYGVDAPRQDYDPATGQSLGILIENAQTNFLAHSVASAAPWGLSGGSASDLSLNALGVFPGLLITSNGATYHRVNHPNVMLTAGETYTLSVWFQLGSSPNFRTVFRATTGEQTNDAGSLSSHEPALQDASGHVSLVKLSEFSDGTNLLELNFVPNLTADYSIGFGPHSATTGEDAIILGMQLVNGDTPSSFILTNGSVQSRSQDIVGLTGLSGLYDIDVVYGDNSTEHFSSQTVTEGYWPTLSQHHIKSMVAFPS